MTYQRYVAPEEDQPEDQQLAQEQLEARITAEAGELYRKVPEWRDEKTRHAELDAVVSHAKAQGFTEEELHAIGAREWITLRKGWQADGRPKTRDQQTAEIIKAKHTLRQTGKVKDAAAAIEKRLNKRGR